MTFGQVLSEIYNWYCRKRDPLQALCDADLIDRIEALEGQTVTKQDIRPEVYAGRSANGLVSSFTRDAIMTRTAAGQWRVRFASAHPDGANYAPWLTAEEQSNLRDTPDITIVQGTQNANSFDVQITTGDNGGTADVYVDTPWSWGVNAPVSVVTDVVVA